MDDLEAMRSAIDVLVARSMAQEAVLAYFMRHAQMTTGPFPEMDFADLAEKHRAALRHSPLTDRQISIYETELQRLLQSLHSTGGPELLDLPF